MATAATVSAPGLAWYAAEEADAYDRNQYEVMEGTAQPMKESILIKAGNHVRDGWYRVKLKAGLIPPDPCPACGMG